jgi:hypothetical protein
VTHVETESGVVEDAQRILFTGKVSHQPRKFLVAFGRRCRERKKGKDMGRGVLRRYG